MFDDELFEEVENQLKQNGYMTTPLGLLPINYEGMRTLVDALNLLIKEMDEFKIRGAHADCNPTNAHTWDVLRYYDYLEGIDRVIREKAGKALKRLNLEFKN